jgi:hypothetical protein
MRMFFLLAALVSLSSCTSVVLKPVEFAWPVERVLEVDGKGTIHDDRYMFTVNVRPLFYEETQDSANVFGQSVRVIRDYPGYYYMTAKGFRHVYVFSESEGALYLEKKIEVSKGPVSEPAFNQRPPYIQLLDGSAELKVLNSDGIVEGVKP